MRKPWGGVVGNPLGNPVLRNLSPSQRSSERYETIELTGKFEGNGQITETILLPSPRSNGRITFENYWSGLPGNGGTREDKTGPMDYRTDVVKGPEDVIYNRIINDLGYRTAGQILEDFMINKQYPEARSYGGECR